MADAQNKFMQLRKSLQELYIPPMTKISTEIRFLERLISRKPIYSRLSDPNTWQYESFKEQYQNMSSEILLNRVEVLERYLSSSAIGMTPFSNEYTLQINHIIPYIEWGKLEESFAISDFLGYPFVIVFASELSLSDIESMLETLAENVITRKPIDVIFVDKNKDVKLNSMYNNIRCFDLDTNSVRIGDVYTQYRVKSKVTLNLFNINSKMIFLIDNNGKLQNMYAKQEIPDLIKTFSLMG